MTQKLSYLTKVRVHGSQDQSPWGWRPMTMLDYTKIIREGGKTEIENSLGTLCFLRVSQAVKAKFSILRGPLLEANLLGLLCGTFQRIREFKNTP